MNVPLFPAPVAVAPEKDRLDGERLCFVGRFSSAPRKRLSSLVQEYGAEVVTDRADATLLVQGEGGPIGNAASLEPMLTETQLLERLGVLEGGDEVKRLYTPAMLAELTGAPLVAIRRWERRGYLQPTEQLGRLTRFDFAEANVTQLLADLLGAGKSLAAIDRMVVSIEAAHPRLERPLVDLPLVLVEGALLVRDGEQLAEPHGQRRLDFAASEDDADDEDVRPAVAVVLAVDEPTEELVVLDSREASRRVALELRDAGDTRGALERYRVAVGADRPDAEDHFTLAELLYEVGDAAAARERYYAALELDPDYLEARLNLGCLLAAEGDLPLAIAALEGALDCYEAYADAHYHLACTLDRAGRDAEAEPHWRRFLEIAPESPWADEARERLGS